MAEEGPLAMVIEIARGFGFVLPKAFHRSVLVSFCQKRKRDPESNAAALVD
jgi:hypothetical protein